MFGQFTLNGGFQTILCFVLILLIGGFAYIEISRLKKRVNSLSNEIKMLSHPVKQSETTQDLGVSFDTKIHPENNSVFVDQTFDAIQQTDLFALMKDPVISSIDEVTQSHEQIIDTKEQPQPDVVSQPQPDVVSQPEEEVVSQPEEEVVSSDTPDDTIKIITSKPSSVYDSKTVSELKEILQEKGLPLSGNKTKLIKRILEHEQTQK
uniref:SAP domain-containing protein n=1 Tax=viral metagenome TaxID=1070528 RepID=A0A6C0F5H8_9ZZZZ